MYHDSISYGIRLNDIYRKDSIRYASYRFYTIYESLWPNFPLIVCSGVVRPILYHVHSLDALMNCYNFRDQFATKSGSQVGIFRFQGLMINLAWILSWHLTNQGIKRQFSILKIYKLKMAGRFKSFTPFI